MRARSPIAWCAIDTLCSLLLVIYVMIAPPPKHHRPPSIPTFGSYAIVMTWPGSNQDDVDLHVVSPDGEDAYFASPSTRDMNLEHDDIPGYDVKEKTHHERTIIRAAQRGEYVVNAHLFGKRTPGPVSVTVTLYRLRGSDKTIITERFTLFGGGQEHTAFRFTLNGAGDISSINHLQKRLIGGGP